MISDLPPEPTYTQVQTLVDEFKASGADFIVAVGGGSAMDAAKLASLLATESYTVKDLLDNPGLAVKTVENLPDSHHRRYRLRGYPQRHRGRAREGAEGGHRQRQHGA